VRTSHLGMAVDPAVFDIVHSTLRRNREEREQITGVTGSPATRSVAPSVSAG
jgi:hypothetical protein